MLCGEGGGGGGLLKYEAYVCKGNQSEKVAAGHLEHLLPHLPKINDLQAKGFDANFDLKLPKDLHGAEWFSKATVKRFLHIVNSPDSINVIKTILDEMSQLEDTKKFHVSLYGKPEVSTVSSDASKNELLRAMDLRLTALRNKLAETFNKAADAKCSPKDMTYLVKFSQHFGATNIEHTLYKFIELNRLSVDVGPLNNETTMLTCDVTHALGNDASRAIKDLQISKPLISDAPVKYGVSPAKAAQFERQSSTGSEESSDSSDEDQPSAERSRSLVRSVTPRRSASPMRRVQIGKAGPRRAAALTIKSLNFFPARSYRDAAENGFEGEGSEQRYKKTEIDVRRITVQDAISLFEGKQRDQSDDIQKRKSSTDVSLSTNKSVLRRWSSGMGETSVQGLADPVPEDPEDPIPVTSNDAIHDENPKNSEVEIVSDFISESHNNNEIPDCNVKPERQENIDSYTVDNKEETGPKAREETIKKLAASAEWNQRKQAEFNQILKKMVESKPVLFGKPQPSKKQNISSEQRGQSYDHYKEKRDAKLRAEKVGKRVEKEARIHGMQQLVDKKAEMSKNVSASKKSATKLPQKPLRSSPQPVSSPKETPKPTVAKKASARSSSLPATRKSWSATPSPKTAGTSPAKGRGGTSSASSTPTHRKPVSTASVPQTSPQKEKSQQRSKNEKEVQSHNTRNLKSTNEKRQTGVPNKSNAIKSKVTPNSGETVPSKTTLGNKGTKKSSVVPLESKPFLRKGSRMGNGTGDPIKRKTPPKLDKSHRDAEDRIEDQDSELVVNASDSASRHSDGETMTPNHHNTATESDPQNQIENHLLCGETENLDRDSGAVDVLTYIEESSLNVRNEEESTISPSAWVETEEDLELPKPCEDSTFHFKPASLANAAPAGSTSPRVRHSLSQMLQEEISEPDICEWGNAENPPTMLYQKDAPKGFKRLLKFARKNKGDTGSTGWSSPSVFSEGEDDAEELKNSNKRNADNLLRKAALNAKSYGQPKSSVHEGYDYLAGDDGKGSHKMQGGRDSGAGTATRGSRSFFSLSAFRGTKP
ncbi:hypothetical protein TSUD_302930 [Trifolium subterraneum]|uniref:COP1-interacting protein 7 n=1 Tax=Trifolium subterraneum TaxID=3900 RepID=A0A2Z6PF31_TRISU|nr:hypothetical protein TSUD_302930 [Trifolium subterraneum]